MTAFASALLLTLTGCAATMANRGTDLRGVRNRTDVEQRLGRSVNDQAWDNGWSLATYKVHVPDRNRADMHAFMSGFTLGLWDIVAVPAEMMRDQPTMTILYAPNGNVLAWKAPWGAGPEWKDLPVMPVVREMESGRCPLVAHCVLRFEAEVRKVTDWLGTRLPAATELKLRFAREIGADADAGRVSTSAAANRLIMLDAASEAKR